MPRSRPSTTAESARVEAFSDGVLAIVITLLVLELHTPETRGDVLHGLLDQWPTYVAYLASFLYVGVIWVNHHQLFGRIAAVDTGLLWRNLLLLLVTSLLPFPTSVVGSALQHGTREDEVVALALYGLVGMGMSLSWGLVFRYLDRNPQLVGPGTPPDFFRLESRRSQLGAVANVLAALVAVALPVLGLAVLGVLPVFYALTSDGLLSRARD